MAEQTVFDYTLNVASRGNIVFLYSGRHSYSDTGSGQKPWQLALYMDGALVNSTGGSGAVTDTPNLQAVAIGVQPGDHHVVATWFGHTSIRFSGAVLSIQEAYK